MAMTIADLARTISKDKRIGVTRRQAMLVIISVFKYVIEEMVASPDSAVVNFQGFGKFYGRKYTQYEIHFDESLKKDDKPIISYNMRFVPSTRVKKAMNGKLHVDDMLIANYFLKTLSARPMKPPVNCGEKRKPIEFTSGAMAITHSNLSARAREVANKRAEEEKKKKQQEVVDLKSRLPKG